MLFMKKVILELGDFGKKELSKIGVSEELLRTLVYEGIYNIPYSKVFDGKEADEFFVLRKGTEYIYCVVGNFIGLVSESDMCILVEELPWELLEGCTAYQVDLLLEGSPEAPFSLKEKIKACVQHHAYA